MIASDADVLALKERFPICEVRTESTVAPSVHTVSPRRCTPLLVTPPVRALSSQESYGILFGMDAM